MDEDKRPSPLELEGAGLVTGHDFRPGEKVERYLLDVPDHPGQPCTVEALSRVTGEIYVVGETFGMWWSPAHTTIGIRRAS